MVPLANLFLNLSTVHCSKLPFFPPIQCNNCQAAINIPRNKLDRDYGPLNEVFNEMIPCGRRNCCMLDPVKFLCNQTVCQMYKVFGKDQVLSLYMDADHLTVVGLKQIFPLYDDWQKYCETPQKYRIWNKHIISWILNKKSCNFVLKKASELFIVRVRTIFCTIHRTRRNVWKALCKMKFSNSYQTEITNRQRKTQLKPIVLCLIGDFFSNVESHKKGIKTIQHNLRTLTFTTSRIQ